MNGIEALQEALMGKEIKRKGWVDKHRLSFKIGLGKFTLIGDTVNSSPIHIPKEDLEAEDWEIYGEKPKYKEVSFQEAVKWCDNHPETLIDIKPNQGFLSFSLKSSIDGEIFVCRSKNDCQPLRVTKLLFEIKWLIPMEKNDENI